MSKDEMFSASSLPKITNLARVPDKGSVLSKDRLADMQLLLLGAFRKGTSCFEIEATDKLCYLGEKIKCNIKINKQ